MKEYIVQYESFNVYEEVVREAVFDFRVLPCNDHSQVVTHYQMGNSSHESIFSFKNLFGFDVNRIRTTKSFLEFTFKLEAHVQKSNAGWVPFQFLSKEEEERIIDSQNFYIDHHLFLQKTYYTEISSIHLPHFAKYNSSIKVFDFLLSLNQDIHKLLDYKISTTDVKTTANKALEIKSGVCQDFAHIFIGVCRHNKIPARYISGYLNQGVNIVGNTLMHAWAEAFIPGIGWVGYDPTNNVLVDEHYIKVSHGADYSDCSPIKGVLKTKGRNKTTYSVTVKDQLDQQQQQQQ